MGAQQYSNLIKKHIAIFGPDITVAQLEGIKGLEIDGDGNMTKMPQQTNNFAEILLQTWEQLSPFLAKTIAEEELKISKN